jgi:hypothetical protein
MDMMRLPIWDTGFKDLSTREFGEIFASHKLKRTEKLEETGELGEYLPDCVGGSVIILGRSRVEMEETEMRFEKEYSNRMIHRMIPSSRENFEGLGSPLYRPRYTS